ncbi:solute carrier family 15 member 2 isoform X1 [Hydra vulgaris]|uniref:Solute carrier family 15 member 2 n=1 Tax=Hydra vulgaris TaxID=6087 RepID=T2MCC7_HYDVU|nr:solute carrier family 15 member 2 [Hydra vulgaris]
MSSYKSVPVEEQSENEEAVKVAPKQKLIFGYPVQVLFILGNEFCERFSYYGMHAILVIYLTTMLNMSKDDATAVYHAFNMLCYFSPIFGAIIADSFWGKYKTIMYVSVIYAVGNIVVSVTAVPSVLHELKFAGPAIGLVLIALGTGGIKPCVSAFGGDQFEAGQDDKLRSFFSIFYFSINFGSLIATLLTPVLRGDVQCFGYDCYPLAFGVPAILMVVALLLFLAGSSLYKKVPPEGNVVVEVSSAVGSALKNRIANCGSGTKKDHWMDWAGQEYSPVLISDIKALFKVLFMFLPLPVFWTLFDQQGSRWTLQAMEMNGDIGYLGTVKPDQMQALNPVFVMILIPFVEAVVYPLGRKCRFLTKPLQRMGFGMALTAISFVVAGFLQIKMEAKSSVADLPATGFANYRFVNTVPCEIDIYGPDMVITNVSVGYQQGTEYFAIPITINSIYISTDCPPKMNAEPNIYVEEKGSYTMVIGANHSRLAVMQLADDITPLPHGHAKVRFLHAGGSVSDKVTVHMNKTLSIDLLPFTKPDYINIVAKTYKVRVAPTGTVNALALRSISFGNGGIYTVVIQPNKKLQGLKMLEYADLSPRPINILWQIPQYIIITLGEVMFSITGLEFAYSQSPPSMKSCIMAAWLLTVSVGNLLVVILAGVKLTDDMAEEFFFFAILLAVVTVIFAIMAYFYTYIYYGSSRETDPNPNGCTEATEAILTSDKELEKHGTTEATEVTPLVTDIELKKHGTTEKTHINQ